jgi:crotonobetainyl-CoA:carnitine CoA-transferase CaiB-like acyl-CoA transferase
MSANTPATPRPLDGVRVLDFSTLLPGPLATLVLAEAGAEVLKIERPGVGDEMRSYEPAFGEGSVNFALLNRGKRSLAVDLKKPEVVRQLLALAAQADIVIEQFRPGVMDRLGLGYEAMAAANPRIIYCAITGWGQTGPKRDVAAHDLNYVAESGMLGLAAGNDGAPVVPPALIADIAGGTYPALVNILLALRQRDLTGRGCRLDVAMADNLFTFMYWAIGNARAAGQWPTPGGDLVTGGSPRYQIYRTLDGRFVAAAPLEDKFWANFLQAIEAPATLEQDAGSPAATRAEVQRRIGAQTAAHWAARFAGRDLCCSIVPTLREALDDPHFAARGLFDHTLLGDGVAPMPALPVPVDAALRGAAQERAAPRLGEANGDYGFGSD